MSSLVDTGNVTSHSWIKGCSSWKGVFKKRADHYVADPKTKQVTN